MRRAIINLDVRQPQDLVLARQRARHIAALLGFDAQDQTRLATAVSEITRNALQYAGEAKVGFAVEEDATQAFVITIHDHGPGIKDLQAVLDGNFASASGRGQAIAGVRRLMDRFRIESTTKGTLVIFGKDIPKRAGAFHVIDLDKIADELAKRTPQDPFEELREQNTELLRTLEELRHRQADLAQAHLDLQRRETDLSDLNRELEDTNRGVVALYAELEEKAEFLGRASEMKSRFLSNMSHEFRTPLNSVTGLTRLLLDRTDGDLTPEQETQVMLIRRAIDNLTELVNDLLDLAKVEAGKVVVRASEFDPVSLFGGLRGMLRPLLTANSRVELIFDEPAGLPPLCTDESKVSQILRNFISNALKFTEQGEIRVTAKLGENDTVLLSVKDTGIGIALEDQARIFDEFTQIENPHQKRAKGTGLGLPLVKKLAELLGGRVTLHSEPGSGSIFTAIIPRLYQGPAETAHVPEVTSKMEPGRRPVLVVEDNSEALFIYDKYLKGTDFQVMPARNLRMARQALTQFRPCAVILDVLLDRETGWDLLAELKASEKLRDIPVLVITLVENEPKALALGAEAFCVKPVDRNWLLQKLATFQAAPSQPKILVIDDDEISRYLVREALKGFGTDLLEASNGEEGIRQVKEHHPNIVVLDFELPDSSGLQILRALRSSPASARTPVLINSAKVLSRDERNSLTEAGATTILSKEKLGTDEGRQQLRQAVQTLGLHS
jgi:signal transduction histidine kinase/CheY-like chemotaxis protein